MPRRICQTEIRQRRHGKPSSLLAPVDVLRDGQTRERQFTEREAHDAASEATPWPIRTFAPAGCYGESAKWRSAKATP